MSVESKNQLLILIVNSIKSHDPLINFAMDISHENWGGERIEIQRTADNKVLTLCFQQQELRLDVGRSINSTEYFFNGRRYRQISSEGIGYVEDNTSQNDEVWKKCKAWIDEQILEPLGLPDTRDGWMTFFEALPWVSCQTIMVHRPKVNNRVKRNARHDKRRIAQLEALVESLGGSSDSKFGKKMSKPASYETLEYEEIQKYTKCTHCLKWTLVFLLGALIALVLAHTSYDFEDDATLPKITIQSLEIPQDVQELLDRISTDYFQEDYRRPGIKLREQGLEKHYPVILIPGIVSTALEVWDGEYCAMSKNFRQRFWGSAVMIRQILLDSRCWLRHMRLNHTSGLDPNNIKLRPATGIAAADYLVGNFWVWAKIIENLADLGYDENSMHLAGYDWRLAYNDLESRDYFYSRLKNTIEMSAYMHENKKVVIVCHSMGGNVIQYFLGWVTQKDPKWVDKHIESIAYIATPFLGVPKTISSLISGEMKDTAELGDWLDSLRQRVFSTEDVAGMLRTFRSIPGLIPKGGDKIWTKPLVVLNYTEHSTEETLDFMRRILPEYMKHIDDIYSFGIASKKNLSSSTYLTDYSHWANPLESPLPYAPNMKLYSIYGVGMDTEEGYYYQNRINFNGNTTKEFEKVEYLIDKSISHDSVNRGVRMTLGDGTVPLLSLGYMLSKGGGWSNKRLNPSGVKTIIREYKQSNVTFADKLMRGPSSVDHVDIMGNDDVISDILFIAGKRKNPGLVRDNKLKTRQVETKDGYYTHILEDLIHSNIQELSNNIDLDI